MARGADVDKPFCNAMPPRPGRLADVAWNDALWDNGVRQIGLGPAGRTRTGLGSRADSTWWVIGGSWRMRACAVRGSA